MAQSLIVEDDMMFQRVLSRGLEAGRARAGEIAGDGLYGLDPLDLMLEEDGLHGLEVLARIRDLHPELPVIITGVWHGRGGGGSDEERGQRISLYTVKVSVTNAPSWRSAG